MDQIIIGILFVIGILWASARAGKGPHEQYDQDRQEQRRWGL